MKRKFLIITSIIVNFIQTAEYTPEYVEFIQKFPNATDNQKIRCRATSLRIAKINREIVQAKQELQQEKHAFYRQLISMCCPCLGFGVQ